MTPQPHTRMVVARHGETLWNQEGRMQGQLDSALTLEGVRQARILGREIARFEPVCLYSSDLGRAVHTAEIVAESSRVSVHQCPDLRERAFGVFEGLTQHAAQEQFPELYRRHRSQDPDFELPGGESLSKHQDRVVRALRAIVRRHIGETIVIITHGGPLSVLYRFCMDMPLSAPRTFSLDNGRPSIIRVDEARFSIDTWCGKELR